MIKVNIEKELKREQERNTFSEESVVEQFKLLENSSAREDLKIALALGSENSIAYAQQEHGKAIELDKLNKTYKNGVYTVDEIKALCIKYRLRFLHSAHFTGVINTNVIAEVKKFGKETLTPITEENLKRNFYVMATADQFKLEFQKVERRYLPNIDPSLFYEIDDNHYRFIYKWGKDFTITRYLIALKWKNNKTLALFKAAVWFLVSVFISGLICYLCADSKDADMTAVKIILGIAVGVFTVGRYLWAADFYEQKANFFTWYNWRSTEKSIIV